MLSSFLSKGYFFHKEILKTDINTDVQIVVKGKMNQMLPLENNPSPSAWPEEADGGSLVTEMGHLHGVESFWHSPLWPVFWTNTKASKWEPWFSVSSPVTVLKVHVTAGIVCSARTAHRPFEILGPTLRSEQYQGTEFQAPIAMFLRFSGGVLAQKLIHLLRQFHWLDPAKAQACQRKPTVECQGDGVIPGHQLWWGFLFGSSNSLGLCVKLDFCKVSSETVNTLPWGCSLSFSDLNLKTEVSL